jgi:hypothetical protein
MPQKKSRLPQRKQPEDCMSGRVLAVQPEKRFIFQSDIIKSNDWLLFKVTLPRYGFVLECTWRYHCRKSKNARLLSKALDRAAAYLREMQNGRPMSGEAPVKLSLAGK